MKPKLPLKLIQYAPIAAAALVLAVWFATPSELRLQMLSTKTSTVPLDTITQSIDRESVAARWLDADTRARASKQWADVRFAEAASKTSLRAAGHFDAIVSSGTATAFMFASDSPDFAQLRDFARVFPDAHVDAYMVEQPPMPRVMFMGGVPLGHLPKSPFGAAWTVSVNTPKRAAFDPRVWTGYSANVTDSAIYAGWDVPGDNQVISFTWQTEDAEIYRAYAYVPPRALLGHRTPLTVSGGGVFPKLMHVHEYKTTLPNLDNWNGCAACHTSDSSLGDEGSGDVNADSKPIATAVYVGGPVALQAKAQFTTRDHAQSERMGRPAALYALANADTSYITRPATLATYTADPFASLVWEIPDLPQGGGQTMLFVATYATDPHGAYNSWRASRLGEAVMAIRTWLAVQLPWLLAITCTLLGVSLIASPLAFASERRSARRDETSRELARIQRDAHDRVYNRLGALSKRVDGAAANVAGDTAQDLTRVAEDIRATLEDLQAILSRDVEHTGDVEGGALVSQLRATAAAQAALHSIAIDFLAPDVTPSLPARLGWDLQCVLDEAITNAARHGGATHLHVQLLVESDSLRLEVADDGSSAAGEGEGARESTGLAGMSERLAAWGGEVRFDRDNGGAAGSLLQVTVPLPVKA